MELSPKELEHLRKYTIGELAEEEFLEITKNQIAQYLKTNSEEKFRVLLHKTILEVFPTQYSHN